MASDTSYIAARVGKALKRKLTRASKATGFNESDLLRMAVEDFLRKSPSDQIAAVIRMRSASAEGVA